MTKQTETVFVIYVNKAERKEYNIEHTMDPGGKAKLILEAWLKETREMTEGDSEDDDPNTWTKEYLFYDKGSCEVFCSFTPYRGEEVKFFFNVL